MARCFFSDLVSSNKQLGCLKMKNMTFLIHMFCFFLYYSSYILVMIAMDRFQAICYPMNNHFWQPSRSKQKIFIAWTLSIIMCIPHGLIFKETDNNGDHGGTTCSAQLGETPQGLFLYVIHLLFCFEKMIQLIEINQKRCQITYPYQLIVLLTHGGSKISLIFSKNWLQRKCCIL